MSTPADKRHNTSPHARRSQRFRARGLLLLTLLLVLILAWPAVQDQIPFFSGRGESGTAGEVGSGLVQDSASAGVQDPELPPLTLMPSVTSLPTRAPTDTPALTPTETPPGEALGEVSDLIILALDEAGYSHLFAYHPETQPLLRLTSGPWSDIHPALSPDGASLAFSSNRAGYWDLFILDLASGVVRRVTESLEYEAAPSWSPDGLWLAYEAYADDNLELFVAPVAGDQPAIRLTRHPGPDYAPAWSPQGRTVAFVSVRTGEPEIWLADLDKGGEERFRNLSQDAAGRQSQPAWSPDGRSLAWATTRDGISQVVTWAIDQPPTAQQIVGSGDWPVWDPQGTIVLSRLPVPNRTYVTAYAAHHGGAVVLPPVLLAGSWDGAAWGRIRLPDPLPAELVRSAQLTPTPHWRPGLDPDPAIPGGRRQLVDLLDVQAPYPQLHDLADESFDALRQRLAQETGWDLLSALENAFVPLTSPLPPGMGEGWLYTGRAFAFNPVPVNAGWIKVVREDLGSQTFWRVYLRTRFQDGAQGRPLRELPWDLGSRNSGDPGAYEQGGRQAPLPAPGYWYDFTRLAQAYGWERQPALANWRTFYPGTRFNEFALTTGIDWRSAMLELYPPEVLVTPTVVVPATRTLTPTPRWYRTPTPSPTATPLPTFTPAWTPAPASNSP